MGLVLRGFAIAVIAGACGDPPLFGPPTESQCPPNSTLTYQSFGQGFMNAYCTRCHSSELEGSARMGATSFHDFDTLYGIRAVADHIDYTSASGPAATNTSMPNTPPYPSLEERKQLGEWLACGTPGMP